MRRRVSVARMRDDERMRRADVLHVDLDAFYASVEQLLDPSLANKAMAVGGGAILACSYEAKKFGVRSGMSVGAAKRLCPNLEVVGGHFSEYQRLSEVVFTICRDFTPIVEQISIDEAFLDVSGSRHLFGPPGQIAQAIRRRVSDETGLAISAGVASTKFLAKVASQVAKPDGCIVVDPERELEFLHPLPVELMWGVGPVTKATLADLGVTTIGQLAELDGATAQSRVGRHRFGHLAALARNQDSRPVVRRRRAGSVGAQSAFGSRDQSTERFREVLQGLAERVGSRLRAKLRAGRTVTVRVRFGDMAAVTRSRTLPQPVSATTALFRIAWDLAQSGMEAAEGRPVNLFGISVSNLETEPAIQLELALDEGDLLRAGSAAAAAREALDASVDDLRGRFGKGAVVAASLLGGGGGVPDQFRELAEFREADDDEGE